MRVRESWRNDLRSVENDNKDGVEGKYPSLHPPSTAEDSLKCHFIRSMPVTYIGESSMKVFQEFLTPPTLPNPSVFFLSLFRLHNETLLSV